MEELKPTSAEEIRKAATKIVESPFTGHCYEIRKSSGLDYLALDFMPAPDPTMPAEKRRKEYDRLIDGDMAMQARIQKAVVAMCTVSPGIVANGKPQDAPKDTVHVEMLGPDIDWLFIEIDEWTRGKDSGNPTTGSAS